MRSVFTHVCLQALLWMAVSSLSTGTRPTRTRNLIMSTETRNSMGHTRRSWLSKTVATTSAFLAQSALPTNAAAVDRLVTFEDPECGFQIKIPSSWEKQVQELPDRRKIVLFIDPTGDKDKTLCFIAYTPVRDDFTQISSFGSVDQVAQTTILPKGSLAGQDNDSAMLNAESKKNAYFFDYRAKAAGQPETHFRTIFTLAQGATGGAGAILVTLTVQTPESRYGDMKVLFDEIMGSYGKV